MKTDVNVNSYGDYRRAVGAPSFLPNNTQFAPPPGERTVDVTNQTTAGNGFTPALTHAATSRRIAGGESSRPGRGGGGQGGRPMQQGMVSRLISSPVALAVSVVLIGYFVFVRRA